MTKPSPPLILDVGSHSIRMGFSGSAEPRMVYPNAVSILSDTHLKHFSHRDTLESESTEKLRRFEDNRKSYLLTHHDIDSKNINSVLQRKRLKDQSRKSRTRFRTFGEFPVDPLAKLDDVELDEVLSCRNAGGCPTYSVNMDCLGLIGDNLWGLDAVVVPDIIFLEPSPAQMKLKAQYIETAFELWLAPSCLSAPSQIFQAAGAATPTSMIVDVGHSHVTSCLVVDGYIHPSTVSTSCDAMKSLDTSMLKALEEANGIDKLKPLSSFFQHGGVPLDLLSMDGNAKTSFDSHPLPFATATVLDWQRNLLVQIIRESFADDSCVAKDMNNYVLPDGTLINTDGTIYSNMSNYLCGNKALPKKLSQKNIPSNATSGKGTGNNKFMTIKEVVNVTAEAIYKLVDGKNSNVRGKKKNTGHTEKSSTIVGGAVTAPNKVTLSGGGTLLHGFDTAMNDLLTKYGTEVMGSIGLKGEGSVQYSHKSKQNARSLWESVQENPTCTNTLLNALNLRSEEATTQAPVQIIAGTSPQDRIFLGYRGASMIGSVGSFGSLTNTLEDYLEKGLERVSLCQPI